MELTKLPLYFKYIGSKKNELWFFKSSRLDDGTYKEPSKSDLSFNTFRNYKIFERKFGNLRIILKTNDPFIKNVNSLLNQLILVVELEFL